MITPGKWTAVHETGMAAGPWGLHDVDDRQFGLFMREADARITELVPDMIEALKCLHINDWVMCDEASDGVTAILDKLKEAGALE